MILYAQTSGEQSTNAGSLVPVPGLSFTLPEGVGTLALVILNFPNPYATGDANPGGVFGISVNGAVSPVTACFTNEAVPPSTARVPTTLVVGVPLVNKQQTIVGMWMGVRGSTVIIDSPATLSAIVS
jgi:hypothetical protein